MSDLHDAARNAIALAKKKGAQEATASAYRSRDVEVVWRDGRVEKVSESTTRGLSLALFVDERYSAVGTSDLRPEALDAFLTESVAMARTLSKDPHRRLPEPKLYEGRSTVDLQIDDPRYTERTAEQRRELAAEIEAAARAVRGKGELLSVDARVSDTQSRTVRITTNGFEGETRSTSYWLRASTTVKDPDGRRPEGNDSAGTRALSEMPSAADVGRRASERAFQAVGAAKMASAVLPIVIENRVAGRVLGALLGPLSGQALQQKQSFLDGQLGKSVASKLLTIDDDPLLSKGFGSRLYDADGIAARRRPIVEGGVLKTYFINVYYGRKLDAAPTASGPSNVVFALGDKGLEELLKGVGDGVLITGFLGGNSNATTGDFSFGIQGFRVEKGRRTTPLAEMNIAGNHKTFWKSLVAVGRDPHPYSSLRTPTLVFDGVQVAGG